MCRRIIRIDEVCPNTHFRQLQKTILSFYSFRLKQRCNVKLCFQLGRAFSGSGVRGRLSSGVLNSAASERYELCCSYMYKEAVIVRLLLVTCICGFSFIE